MSLDLKESIETTLKTFDRSSLREAGIDLFRSIGYESKKTLRLKDNTLAGFTKQFPGAKNLNHDRAMSANWKTIDVLFQLTDDEVRQGLGFGQEDMFTSDGQVDDQRIESYLFVAIELKAKDDGTNYTRTDLSRITRALNHQDVFRVPIMLLFRHGDCLSLAVINRRLHKRDASRDVLEKVTLIKDITYADPLRAHIEILHDLALPKLYDEYKFTGFVGLHQAWEKRLASYALNERFYREIADWYFDALQNPKVVMPRTIAEMTDDVERDKARSLFFIRLLTRLIFCWFLQEKGLVPRDLFRERRMKELLKDASPTAGTYYRAFLQNLFFATLNQEQDKRDWREKADGNARYDKNVGITHLWRFKDDLRDPAALEALLRDRVPFVNGGLFDCLDDQYVEPKVFLDGFSERKTNTLHVPNALFFGKERTVDLSDVLHDKRRSREKVSGLINILSRYKFTIEENTPLEEEIALDPELLGKVFENLLASFNEDTQTTARKALGAFYTPRAVVSYMVDEALCSYLGSKVPSVDHEQLTHLMKAHPDEYEATEHFTPEEIKALVTAIGSVRIIDHAAGSGAYPMGALQRLVDLLQKLDPNNESWKRDRLEEARRYYESLRMANATDEELRQVEDRIADIEKSFDTHYHELDYARKLFLIENSIYGVDIQPVACQIAKLRFFIAMIVDQKVKREARNLGVRPMPNLETKIVAANALLPIDTSEGEHYDFFAGSIQKYREELLKVRHDHFDARTPAKKSKLRKRDAELRKAIADELESTGLPSEKAAKLASWDPYDQNRYAEYFDPSWMFGFKRDDALFDIVLGNPPYVRIQTLKRQDPKQVAQFKETYEAASKGNYDLYVVFVESGLNLLREGGHLAFILPHKFFNAEYGEPLRRLISRGRHLQHVVHFGDQQVFPGASNYVCLLFLSKTPVHKCRYVQVESFMGWQTSGLSEVATIPSDLVTGAPWTFSVGKDAAVMQHLRKSERVLGDIADLFVGLQTDADDVFIVEVEKEEQGVTYARSKHTGQLHRFETDHLKPFLKGSLNIRPYHLSDLTKKLIFPYENVDGKSELISERAYKRQHPLTWSYLHDCKDRLSERASGNFKDFWYGYVYKKNHTRFDQAKLVVPAIGTRSCFAPDMAGKYYFVGSGGGGGGGYGVLVKEGENLSLLALLAVLNSSVSTYFIRNVSTPFRGGYFALTRQFIEQLPIPSLPLSKQTALELLVRHLVTLYAEKDSLPPRDTLMLGYFEQILNALVYELYFPEDLHKKGLKIFDLVEKAKLPDIESLSEPKCLPTLRDTFERLYDLKHPLRGALQTLRSLDVVRIIEGDEGQ